MKSVEIYLQELFPQFEPALKQKLIEVATVKSFSDGEMMMETGQYFRFAMLIVQGKVKLYREGDDGGEFFMYYLDPGNACALSLICAAKQETSQIKAKSLEDTVVITIPINLMDELMRSYKTWYYFVLETYRARFEELLSVIDGITFKALDERLGFYLKNQYQKLKTRQLQITHQEIANDLNSSREVISRLLKKMEQKGDVILHRNYIEILN
jgi:CRP/FNR family transcriptional regulator, anaerobic regulatory protein